MMASFLIDDIITIDKFQSLASKDIIYKNGWSDEPGKIWITVNSEYDVNQDVFNKYKHNCNTWFATNKTHENKKLHSLPMGVTNEAFVTDLHPTFGNIDIIIEKMHQPQNILNLLYMNFNISAFPYERQSCYDIFKGKPWVTIGDIDNTLVGISRFLQDIRNHKFVLCPRGKGIDTHRMWETLYMGSIPIVINAAAHNEFKDLPILFIDAWEEITEDFLNKKYYEMKSQKWNLAKLKFSYWRDKILGSVDGNKIPRIIYQTWKTNDLHPKLRNLRKKMLDINPGYSLELFDDEEIDNFINRHFDKMIYMAFSKLKVGAARADFWRYCVLYLNGGIYLDIDSEILRPMKELINGDEQCIITREGNPGVFNNWIMIFERYHPILKATIDLCVYNINNKVSSNIGHLTGPSGPFTNSVNKIMGEYYHKKTNLYYEKDDELNSCLNNLKNEVRAKFYKVDLDNFARWKHDALTELYNGSIHWTEEKNIYRD